MVNPRDIAGERKKKKKKKKKKIQWFRIVGVNANLQLQSER